MYAESDIIQVLVHHLAAGGIAEIEGNIWLEDTPMQQGNRSDLVAGLGGITDQHIINVQQLVQILAYVQKKLSAR